MLVKIPGLLNNSLRTPYWISLSFIQKCFTGGERIQDIKQHRIFDGKIILELIMTDGRVYVQSSERISRFWRGKNFALERLYTQYLPHFSNTRKLFEQSNPALILDVGGNIGEFSLYCAKKFPNSQILVFEPDPIVFECLQRNIEVEKLQLQITAMKTALSSSNEIQDFYIATDTADSSLVRPEKDFSRISVATRRLDGILSDKEIRKVDLLKMDAEGFEPEVLMGMGETISKCMVFALDVSPERNGSNTIKEVSELLMPLGCDFEHFAGQGKRRFLLATFLTETK